MSRQKTYLILGANGFIGSHLVDRFAAQPEVIVRAFDRFNTPLQFKERGNIQVIGGDIFDDNALKSALEGVDYVIHSFSATTPATTDNDPYTDITHNLLRSVQIFSACVESGVKKVGFISSGGTVYGSLAEKKAVNEKDNTMPVSPYGINKLAIEHYLEYFKQKQGLHYIVYRLSNPYGPRQFTKNGQGVIPLFHNKIKNDEEITIYGDGSMSRDYIYIGDAVDMMANCFENGKYNLYNIASGKQTSLAQIANELSSLLHKDAKIKYMAAPKTFLRHTSISIERYCQEFGEPQFVSLHDGLSRIL